MPNPVATFKTSVGEFSAEIYLDRVPITASNFIDLCQTGSTFPNSESPHQLHTNVSQGSTMAYISTASSLTS